MRWFQESSLDSFLFFMNQAAVRRRRRLLLATGLLFTPLVGWSALGVWLCDWGTRPRIQHADAIIVLGARVNENGQASPILKARAWHGFELWKQGLAPKIVCTGGVGRYAPAESVAAAALLRGWGVPDAAILCEEVSTSTRENAAQAARLLPPHARVIVVSEPFHLWRARRDCAKVNLVAFTSPELPGWKALRVQARAYYALREALLVVRDLVLR